MASSPKPPLDFKQKIFIGAFGVFAVLYFTGGTNVIIDTLYFPWALAKPPLLRSWVGQMTAGNGVPLMIAFDLRRDLTTRGTICVRCSQIEGEAATCDARGTMRRYDVSGSPSQRDGGQLRLGASPAVDPAPDGLELSTLRGAWDRADALDLEADFVWRKGISAISSTNDPATQPVPLKMHAVEQSAIETLCATAAQRLKRGA